MILVKKGSYHNQFDSQASFLFNALFVIPLIFVFIIGFTSTQIYKWYKVLSQNSPIR